MIKSSGCSLMSLFVCLFSKLFLLLCYYIPSLGHGAHAGYARRGTHYIHVLKTFLFQPHICIFHKCFNTILCNKLILNPCLVLSVLPFHTFPPLKFSGNFKVSSPPQLKAHSDLFKQPNIMNITFFINL